MNSVEPRRPRQREITTRINTNTFGDRRIPISTSKLPQVFPWKPIPANIHLEWGDAALGDECVSSLPVGPELLHPRCWIQIVRYQFCFLGHQGVDVLLLDAVAFCGKRWQALPERTQHTLILQLSKTCCQVTAPSVLFIARGDRGPGGKSPNTLAKDRSWPRNGEVPTNANLDWRALGCHRHQESPTSLPGPSPRAATGQLGPGHLACELYVAAMTTSAALMIRTIRALGYEPRAHVVFLPTISRQLRRPARGAFQRATMPRRCPKSAVRGSYGRA